MDHEDSCTFEKAHELWRTGDLDGFLALCHDDITWTVNMDGIAVPYVSSAFGKEDLRWRLIHLGTVFEIRSFDVTSIVYGPEFCSSRAKILYVHRVVGEPLQTVLLFKGWFRDGRLVRIEESVDRNYVEAYDRLMKYLVQSKNIQ